MNEQGFPVSSLRLDTVTNPDRTVVIVRGDVDAATAPQLRAVVDSLLGVSSTIELDLGELGFFDSTGLSVMAGILQRLAPTGGRLELREVPALVVRLLDLSDMSRLVTILTVRE